MFDTDTNQTTGVTMGRIRIIGRPEPDKLPEFALPLHIRSAGANQSQRNWKEHFPAGSKPFVQIFWCEHGCGEIRLNGRTFQLTAGDFFYHLPQDEHHHRTIGDIWNYRWFTMDGSLAETFMRGYGYSQEPKYAGLCPVNLFQELERLILKPTGYTRRHALAVAAEILALAGKADPHPQRDPVEYFLKEIEDNLANPALSAGRIASDLGIHRTTFTRIFKAKTGGLSPGNYLREARINLAMKLLKDTVMPLKEIAMECGFANSAYLCRIIMERTGYTPEMFRKQKQDQ